MKTFILFCQKIQNESEFYEKHGIPERAKKCIEYVIPDKKYEIGKVTVKTLRSTDAGVAFLVKTCGKTIYHAGDLHNWKMEHVGELINGKMERDYRHQIRKLEGEHINVAFVVLDPRLGEYTDLGLAYFMKMWKLIMYSRCICGRIILPLKIQAKM